MKNLLIEGWRGVNHSFALVNQCQILELQKLDGLRLFHRDVPFAMPHWDAKSVGAGFSDEERARIDSLGEPGDQPLDCVYRISSPTRTGGPNAPACKTITFMITELGMTAKSFEPGAEKSSFFTQGENLIVTSTKWSKDRIVEYGFDADKVHVIPCGVNANTFNPLTPEERAVSRSNLGIKPDEVVYLNLGAAFWNKGADVVLLAFAKLRQRHKHARLILKDQRALYGVSIDQTVKDLTASHPDLFTADTLGAVMVIGVNLSQQQLRLMYGVADCYVSPYRAEGFNLPVLEAIACGTPVVVTDGGSTDDFCPPEVAIRLRSTPGTHTDATGSRLGRFCEPDLDATVEAMERFTQGPGMDMARFEQGRDKLVKAMSWRSVASALRELI
jgi:glycosyltransferase involved in cell wall biosynthesis